MSTINTDSNNTPAETPAPAPAPAKPKVDPKDLAERLRSAVDDAQYAEIEVDLTNYTSYSSSVEVEMSCGSESASLELDADSLIDEIFGQSYINHEVELGEYIEDMSLTILDVARELENAELEAAEPAAHTALVRRPNGAIAVKVEGEFIELTPRTTEALEYQAPEVQPPAIPLTLAETRDFAAKVAEDRKLAAAAREVFDLLK